MNALCTLETSRTYSDPAKRRDYHHTRYLANRERILAKARREREEPATEEATRTHTVPHANDPETVGDPRIIIERDRREALESIRLRLIWASSADGDEAIVARTAVAVIRWAESHGQHFTDWGLRGLHQRLAMAAGLTIHRFYAAKKSLAQTLFIPL